MAGQVVKNLFGQTPTVLMVQVDNGYTVVFSPSQTAARVKCRGVEGSVVSPYVGASAPPSLEEQQKILQQEMERRRGIAVHGLRVKLRVRVYPALSQAMDEVRKFYEAGGVVPGIDFEKLAGEIVDEIGDEDVLAV